MNKTCEGCADNTTYFNGTQCVPFPTISNIKAMENKDYINPENFLKEQQRIADIDANKIPRYICNN